MDFSIWSLIQYVPGQENKVKESQEFLLVIFFDSINYFIRKLKKKPMHLIIEQIVNQFTKRGKTVTNRRERANYLYAALFDIVILPYAAHSSVPNSF